MATSEIIDEATFGRLLESLGGDVDFLGELAEAYLATTPGLFASMRNAVAAGDASGLQRDAHTLKSGSAGFGALAFAAQCKELEDMGKMGTLQGADEKVGALEWSYARVAAALQARVRSARLTSG